MMNQDKISTIKIVICNTVWFVFLYGFSEIYLHIAIYNDNNIFLPVVLCLPMAILAGMISSLFLRKVNIVLGGVITFIVCFLCAVELIYYGIFHMLLAPFSSISMAGNVVDFHNVLFKYVIEHVKKIVICFVPCLLYVLLCFCKMLGRKASEKRTILKGGWLVLLVYSISFFCMLPLGTGLKTPLNNYFFSSQINFNIESLGVITGIRLDFERVFCKKIFGIDTFFYEVFDSNNFIYRGDNTKKPNMIDYDFEDLIRKSNNKEIRMIHEYMKTMEPTYKNEYTGIFEEYNLIFITAEAWWKYAVREDLTPTLYKMLNEGFVFDNFYTPLWYGSTIGGEFANLTGLIPKESGEFSMVVSGENKNDMRFTLSQLLKNKGYGVQAFHSYDYKFFMRNLSHPNMGFKWNAAGNGGYKVERQLDGEMFWPQSDLKLVSDSFKKYGKRNMQPFYTYYMSFSGHADYDVNNDMSMRHWDKVVDLPYSDTAKAYLACNYELELAVEYLIKSLDRKGMLYNTLFVIVPDHIPYGYIDMCSELARENMENNLELYHSSLIVWSASMKEPINVSKYCSSIDVLPTIANMMGLEYDSRFLSGSDIMSDAEQFVIFPDRSWITSKGIYDSNKDSFTLFDDKDISEEYVDSVSEIVEKKVRISTSIVENDYYATLP